MRVPEMLPRDTVNPYLATRAALWLLTGGSITEAGVQTPLSGLVGSVAFPGMGTGIGGVSHARCAWQMRQAILDVLIEPVGIPQDWDEATDRFHVLQKVS